MQFNHECDICLNGNEAIRLINMRILQNLPMYKLILMDFSMPECDGAKATKIIRQNISNSGLQQPLICCLTAYTEDQYKKQA